jgi:hypothetical protein
MMKGLMEYYQLQSKIYQFSSFLTLHTDAQIIPMSMGVIALHTENISEFN